jgi:hypothetical protein
VLGELEIVAAHGFDRAADHGPVDQPDPDRFASPGELAEGERELVAADGRARCRPQWARFRRKGDRDGRAVADQVLGTIGAS